MGQSLQWSRPVLVGRRRRREGDGRRLTSADGDEERRRLQAARPLKSTVSALGTRLPLMLDRTSSERRAEESCLAGGRRATPCDNNARTKRTAGREPARVAPLVVDDVEGLRWPVLFTGGTAASTSRLDTGRLHNNRATDDVASSLLESKSK